MGFAELRAAIVAALALGGATAAQAVTCYVVFDRNDNVIYRDIFPPVDMSDRGIPQREEMRRRGEYMMFVDVDRCPQVEFLTGSAGESALDFARTAPGSGSSDATVMPSASVRPMRPVPGSR